MGEFLFYFSDKTLIVVLIKKKLKKIVFIKKDINEGALTLMHNSLTYGILSSPLL